MNADEFNLSRLINSMKELRHMSLGDQVRQALEGEKLGLDAGTLADLIHELEHDIEEHIERLEKMSGAMTEQERNFPENMATSRRAEVAYQSGCDMEEVESLCTAFARAREILAGSAQGAVLDLKLLFSNLPGLAGADGVPKVPAQLLEDLLNGKLPLRKARTTGSAEGELEALFDLERVSAPKNRLPKDWKP